MTSHGANETTAQTWTAGRTDADCVVLAHGGGGERMHRLLHESVLPALYGKRGGGPQAGDGFPPLTDAAVLPWHGEQLVFTTDSYVVAPLEFPGGDIGRLAVCGTVNDLAVMGAKPVALSLGLILEEGLPLGALERLLRSAAAAAEEAGVRLVTGDTKVIERRGGRDGLFINTAGVGVLGAGVRIGLERVAAGDCVLVNGPIAEHGLTILSVREGLEFETELVSDVAPLNGLIGSLLDSGAAVKFLRDATRGGVAGVLADICEGTGLSVEVDEQAIPIRVAAQHAAEMLGLDPLSVANEGKVICVVAASDCGRALDALRSRPEGRAAACIGRVVARKPPMVELRTRLGGRRIVQRPYGEELPRIC